ncbi:MAG: hypothetical protein EZS28_044632 [Streblomastix strix]|uniref:Protein kinase domain-containing protein n=1 Tax=Streblomastix strix TaxID=222440 RepID=A0A5J4TQX3_9EUKA|nr:MAG: hypothetical protein EZS28_044632 [Streblomastix strix]
MNQSSRFLTESTEDAIILQKASCKLLGLVGKGAFGRVYLVDPGDGNEHAAKVMKKKDFSKREWEAAGILASNVDRCPFVIRYDGIFNAVQYVVILMEYANMPSLGSIIDSNGRMQQKQTITKKELKKAMLMIKIFIKKCLNVM